MESLELLLHPIRLRIVHAMSGDRLRTTNELCQDLADVPRTSVYRHVGVLAEAGVLEVVEERRVHGAVERRYRLRRDRASIGRDQAARMSLDDHRQAFALAMGVLLTDFNAYLDNDDADPVGDAVGYTQFALWLSDDERSELVARMVEAISAVRGNVATAGRRPYLLSPILFPTSLSGK